MRKNELTGLLKCAGLSVSNLRENNWELGLLVHGDKVIE